MIERFRRDPGLSFLALALVLAAALYAATLSRGLVNYDDPWLVADNWVLQNASLETLHTIFFDLHSPKRFVLTPEYLPVRDLSIMFDFAIWGHRYEGFHLTNLLVYLASIAIWFAALTSFGIDRKIAGIAILLWAVHPSHAESVAWITERKGLLAVLFAGVATLAYAKYRAGARRWLVLAAIAAVCAVWSKATGAFAIAAIAGLELALPERRVSWRKSFAGLGVIAIAAGLAFVPVIMLATDANVVAAQSAAPAGRLSMILGVHGFYLRSSALAVENAVSYSLSTHGPSVVDILLGAVGLAVFVAIATLRRSPPPLRAGALIWLVGWLPVSHLVLPLQMIFVADRYLLFPTIGFTLLLAVGITHLPRMRYALLSVLVVAASLRTLGAQANWRDSRTLWTAAIESNSGDDRAWAMYIEAVVAEKPADVEALVDKALEHVKSPRLVMRKALFVVGRDRPRGVALMRQAAEGNEAIAMSNLALLLLDDRVFDEALLWARRGATARPTAHARRTLGKVALATGHAAEALPAFEAALAMEPTCQNRFNVALTLVTLQRGPEALPHLDACASDPKLGPRIAALRQQIGAR